MNVISNSYKQAKDYKFNFFKQNAFLEVCHTKTKFAFALTVLGKISCKMLLRFAIVYSSFLMTLIPFLKENLNH